MHPTWLGTDIVVPWRRLEGQLVDEAGADAPQQRAHPVDPVVLPEVGDHGGAKRAGRVHAGAGQGDLKRRGKRSFFDKVHALLL